MGAHARDVASGGRYSLYLLYEYKSTTTDADGVASGGVWGEVGGGGGFKVVDAHDLEDSRVRGYGLEVARVRVAPEVLSVLALLVQKYRY